MEIISCLESRSYEIGIMQSIKKSLHPIGLKNVGGKLKEKPKKAAAKKKKKAKVDLKKSKSTENTFPIRKEVETGKKMQSKLLKDSSSNRSVDPAALQM